MCENDISILIDEIANLQKQLEDKEIELAKLQLKAAKKTEPCYNGMTSEEIMRYSRQMVMPEVGLSGQIAMKNSKILLIGVGGLGCPAALYLTSAGVGEITVVDYDDVELSNLHRQILHTQSDVNVSKVTSAYEHLKRINSNVKIVPLKIHINSRSMRELMKDNNFALVLDGSDNVATRYLLNDICVLTGLPLVSASALQMEGQLSVFNYKDGPCYRCVFPVPPPPNTVKSCGDDGVLGPVPGVMGVLQAIESIKIIIGSPGVLSGYLLLFDASSSTFRKVKLRPRNRSCEVCGDNPVITDLIDYEQFCGNAHDKVIDIDILGSDENIGVEEFSKLLGNNALVVDVRSRMEFDMCSLPRTFNMPLSEIQKDNDSSTLKSLFSTPGTQDVYVICRRGNDSQRAISYMKTKFADLKVKYFNVRGGLHAYSRMVDSTFPVY